jgi:hypothetical protein
MTQRRGACTMAFDRYDQAPPTADENLPVAAAMRV